MAGDESQVDEHETSKAGKWLRRAFLLAIVLGCAVTMSPNVADPDLWGHVQYGRDVLTDGFIAPTTTYSFTAEGYRWINHENLAEVLLACGADTVGPIGLSVAKCLLSLLVIGLIVGYALRQGVHLLTVCVVALVVSINLAFHWSMRPQTLTYTYFTLLIALLTYCFHGWQHKWHLTRRRSETSEVSKTSEVCDESRGLEYSSRRLRWLWLAPILFFLWANTHGGFVAGFCIYTAYLVCRSIEALVTRGRAGWGLVRRFALMVLVAGLATMINPYGPGLQRWLVNAAIMPRPEITEWHAPAWFALESIKLWLIIGLFAVAMFASRRSRDFTHLVVMALALWQAIEHTRHLPFFAILFGFWMPIHVQSLLTRWRIASDRTQFGDDLSPVMRRVVTAGLCLSLALAAFRLGLRVTDLKVDKREYPVAAMQFIADQNLTGRMVVTMNWAQYVIDVFGTRSPATEPGIQVSFDGRFETCYPQEIWDMNFDLALGPGDGNSRCRGKNSPPCDGSRALWFKNPELVFLCRGQPHSQEVMAQHLDQWVLLYQDARAQIWGQRDKYDRLGSPHFIRPADRIIGDKVHKGYVTWPALPVFGRKSNQLAKN